MQVHGKHYRTVWKEASGNGIGIIDQRHLPFAFVEESLQTVEATAIAIRDMHVRGAGCIGATAGYGMYLACHEAAFEGDPDTALQRLAQQLRDTRPTAINLAWAVDRQLKTIRAAGTTPEARIKAALETAEQIANEDADSCKRIGSNGLPLLQNMAEKNGGKTVNILTHCNAGWLAFVDHGSATAPIYAAHRAGLPVHVWVDETRPRNQGARLTAWELQQEGVPHTVIVDNAGGHLMQHGLVDLVITGSDRTTHTGDVANKIGTYLKALAARDNNIPFYVALPSSTLDWTLSDGVGEIPIEERDGDEISTMEGIAEGSDAVSSFKILPDGSPSRNDAFDVTPSRLVTGLITERGICPASKSGIHALFPDLISSEDR
ncbi:MAG: S-methyl-5-thioribose-1-phosphate isomerase [Verrucomicrobiota bacterium]